MEVQKWTGEETITVNSVIAMLNEINEIDPELMSKMTLTRYPCNTEIRDHKTVQAHCYADASMDEPKVGLIGVLNGIIGIDRNHWGPIAADLEKDTLKGFKLTDTEANDKKPEESGQA